MDKAYKLQANAINEKLATYQKDIFHIFQFSKNISRDMVKYIVQVLHDDNNPEVAKVLIETAFAQEAALLTILKILVKTLYVLKHIKKYKYGDYFTLVNTIDKTLDTINNNKAYITKKKYKILLDKFTKENTIPKKSKVLEAQNKTLVYENIKDSINRSYIKFI